LKWEKNRIGIREFTENHDPVNERYGDLSPIYCHCDEEGATNPEFDVALM
jgi:hypothetical protein